MPVITILVMKIGLVYGLAFPKWGLSCVNRVMLNTSQLLSNTSNLTWERLYMENNMGTIWSIKLLKMLLNLEPNVWTIKFTRGIKSVWNSSSNTFSLNAILFVQILNVWTNTICPDT